VLWRFSKYTSLFLSDVLSDDEIPYPNKTILIKLYTTCVKQIMHMNNGDRQKTLKTKKKKFKKQFR
jgi:hypothetical protein